MKKLLASLLCVMMVFCMMPNMAFAEGEPTAVEYVAETNGVGYTTLQEAFAAVPTDGTLATVKLLKDLTLTKDDMKLVPASKYNRQGQDINYFVAYLLGNKKAILDMNGKNISLTYATKCNENEGGSGVIGVLEGAELTITGNGSMDIKGYGVADVWSCSIGSKVTIENGTFSSGTVEGQDDALTPNLVYASHGGELYIKGGLFNATYKDPDLDNVSNAVVKDMACADHTENGNNGALTVVEVTGGTFQGVDPNSDCPQRGQDGNWTNVDVVPEGYTSVNNGDDTWTVSVTDPVAEVNGIGYATLQDAFSAVPTNGTQTTVTLLRNIILTEADTSYLPLYTNVYGKYKHYFAGHVVGGQNAVLNMNGKDISMSFNKETLNPASQYGGSGLICVQDGGQLTITGSGSMTLTGDATAVIWAQSINSKLTVDENCTCTFKAVAGTGATAADAPIVAYASHGGELYIKGGTYIHPYKDETLGNVSYAVLKDMSCPDRTEAGHNNGALTELEVTGGTFQGVDPNYNCPQLGQDGNWTNVDVVPTGYKSVNNGDGTWTVVKEQTSSSGGHSVTIQKPTIIADEGIDWTLNILGTKVTITVKEGYELADVKLNNEGLGKVGEVSGLKTSDTVVITSVKVTDENEALIEKIKNTKLVARSKMSAAKGKKAVKVVWFAKDGSSLDYLEGFEIFRSSKRYEGYTQNAFFETARKAYWNTAIKAGNKYYYKVRGYVTIDGVKYYTDWSTKAWRTVKK